MKTIEEFIEIYKPIANPTTVIFQDKKSDDDYKFNWHSLEENDLLDDNKGENTIWTVIEGERDSLYLKSGYHRVNRLYHYITQVPYTEEIEIELFEGYPELNQDDIENLGFIKRYMQSRDEPEYVETLDKIIEYVKRINA